MLGCWSSACAVRRRSKNYRSGDVIFLLMPCAFRLSNRIVIVAHPSPKPASPRQCPATPRLPARRCSPDPARRHLPARAPRALHSRHLQQPAQHVLVTDLGIPHDGAARLDGLDDLGALVTRQRKARRGAVDLHRAPQRLLGARRHAVVVVGGVGVSGVGGRECARGRPVHVFKRSHARVHGCRSKPRERAVCARLVGCFFRFDSTWRVACCCCAALPFQLSILSSALLFPALPCRFKPLPTLPASPPPPPPPLFLLSSPSCSPVRLVQDDDLVPPRRQRHLFLRKHLDLIAHDVDAAVVRRVELQHGVAVARAQ